VGGRGYSSVLKIPTSIESLANRSIPETDKISNGSYADNLPRATLCIIFKLKNSLDVQIGQAFKCQDR